MLQQCLDELDLSLSRRICKFQHLGPLELRQSSDILPLNESVRTEGDQYLITGDGAKRARYVIAIEHGEDVVETDYEESETVRNTVKGSE